MQANVGMITNAQEKKRWQANCDWWQAVLIPADKIAKADRDKIRASLEVIKANAARITSGAEKQRWEANLELWVLTLRRM